VLTSYKLASAGQNDVSQAGEITLERNKISLKSSVTGLFILIISFAFFSLFVFEIYRIKEVNVDPKPSVTGPAQSTSRLLPGGLGAPPANPAGISATSPSSNDTRPISESAQPQNEPPK
jgi:hypothetical protein